MSAVFPAGVAALLNGEALADKVGAVVQLATVGAEGWAHLAMLSVGEILVTGPSTLRLLLWPRAGSTANVRRDGRLTLSMVENGVPCDLRLQARALPPVEVPGVDEPFAAFEAQLLALKQHHAPYAIVTSGITYRLLEPQAVVDRWTRQIVALAQVPIPGVPAREEGHHRSQRPSSSASSSRRPTGRDSSG